MIATVSPAAKSNLTSIFDEAVLDRIKKWLMRAVLIACCLWLLLRVVVFLFWLPHLRWGVHPRVLLEEALAKQYEGLHIKELLIKRTEFEPKGGFFEFSESGRTTVTAEVLADYHGRERVLTIEGLIVSLYGGDRAFTTSVTFD